MNHTIPDHALTHQAGRKDPTEHDRLDHDHHMPSLIAQLVKNLPAMQETLVLFLDWENPLEKG